MWWQKCCFFHRRKPVVQLSIMEFWKNPCVLSFFALKVFDFHFYSKILAMYHLEDKNLLKTTC